MVLVLWLSKEFFVIVVIKYCNDWNEVGLFDIGFMFVSVFFL